MPDVLLHTPDRDRRMHMQQMNFRQLTKPYGVLDELGDCAV
jgi:hypothetical protein